MRTTTATTNNRMRALICVPFGAVPMRPTQCGLGPATSGRRPTKPLFVIIIVIIISARAPTDGRTQTKKWLYYRSLLSSARRQRRLKLVAERHRSDRKVYPLQYCNSALFRKLFSQTSPPKMKQSRCSLLSSPSSDFLPAPPPPPQYCLRHCSGRHLNISHVCLLGGAHLRSPSVRFGAAAERSEFQLALLRHCSLHTPNTATLI